MVSLTLAPRFLMLRSSLMDGARDERESAQSGVDGSLIDEMLQLSPAERLRLNDRMATLATKLQEAFARGQRDG
jgi:hypothetical protein